MRRREWAFLDRIYRIKKGEGKMKKKVIFIALAVAVAGCVSGPKVDNTPVAALDLNRYLGEWYEI